MHASLDPLCAFETTAIKTSIKLITITIAALTFIFEPI